MKVLCVGDSLGLPREGVSYEETWFYKLKKDHPKDDYIYKFKRALTSRDLVGKSGKDFFGDYSLYYRPDIVIAQFGICDCAPRYINDNKPIWLGLKVIFKKFHLESFFWRTIKIFFKRSSKCVYVPFDEFTKNVFEYVEILKGIESVKKIIFIKIGMPGVNPQKSSPYLTENVDKYNSVFDDVAKKNPTFVNSIMPLNIPDDAYYIDGYHTNALGFELVYKELKDIPCLRSSDI